MRRLPQCIKALLSRAQQVRDAKNLAHRSGVRVIDAEGDAFHVEVGRIIREEPPTPGFGYLFVPRTLSVEEWLKKHPPAEQKTE
ncbi:MAG: hypothetical protein KBI32_10270 [Phycisphaerae bacterium]|nr:hypothetical protein [Phycisphaerae bacterium]